MKKGRNALLSLSKKIAMITGSSFGCGVLVLAGCLLINAAPKDKPKPADLSLSDLRGDRVRLRNHRGKIVVLNFWATWCQPCNEEMPLLVAAEKEYKDRGVVFLGASLDDRQTMSRIPAFLRKYEVAFPIWTGATGDDLAKLGLGEAVPATAFIDKEGVIAARILGQIRDQELKERIEWLLGDRAGPAPPTHVSHVE